MRICIVTTAGQVHGIGGMQDHTADLAKGLVDAGHVVHVITSSHPAGIGSETDGALTWHYVDEVAQRPGLPMRNPAWLRATAQTFARINACEPFDVVHSESTAALGLMHRGVHLSVPVVVKFHGNWLSLVRAALQRGRVTHKASGYWREAKHVAWISGQHLFPPSNAFKFRNCDVIVPTKGQVADTVRSHFLRPEQVHVVANGVDTNAFRPRERGEVRAKLGLPNHFTFLAAGRLNREKGFDIALRAFAQLEERWASARLVVAGNGEEEWFLRGLSDELGIADRVSFLGAQPRDRMTLVMAAADALLFPTQRDEAAPLIALQAMASGVPLIASSIPALREFAGPKDAGVLFVPLGDPRALRSQMIRAMENDDLRDRLSRAARRRILQEYSLDRMVSATLFVYEAARRRHWNGM